MSVEHDGLRVVVEKGMATLCSPLPLLLREQRSWWRGRRELCCKAAWLELWRVADPVPS